jgi:hypothetical protein
MIVREGQEVEGQQVVVVGIVVLEIRVIRVEAGQGDAAAVVRVEPVTEVRVVTAREVAVGIAGQEVTMVVVVIDLTLMQGQAAAQPSNLPMICLIPLLARRKMPSVRDMAEGAILASSRRRRAVVLVANRGEVHAVVVVVVVVVRKEEEGEVIAGIDRIMIGTMMTNSRAKVW